jgi:hypothetical protein
MGFALVVAGASLPFAAAQQPALPALEHDYPIRPVPAPQVDLNATQVEGATFLWNTLNAQWRARDLPNALAAWERMGMLRNFERAAGKREGLYESRRMNDSDVFKVLEGICHYLANGHESFSAAAGTATLDEIEALADRLIALAAAAQQPDGYLMTSHSVPAPEGWSPPGGMGHFANLRSSHELYSAGHMYEAAAAHYLATGKRTLLDVAVKSADLVCATFGPGRRLDPPGHQEIELGLSKLYRATGERKYLDMAKFFIDQRGNAEGHRLYGEYAQDHLPVMEQTEVVGHAVRAMYLYAGMAEVTALTGDRTYLPVLERLWDDVVGAKLYVTGGLGSRRQNEGFGAAYDLPNETAYCETCAAVAMIFFSQRMFQLTGDAKYLDVVELELYNGVAVGRDPDAALYYYSCPITTTRGRARREWYDTPCCPSNLIRFMPQAGGYLYAVGDDAVYVNQYARGVVRAQAGGGELRLATSTQYPRDGDVKIVLQTAGPRRVALNLRIPGWARGRPFPGELYTYLDGATEAVTLKVNGETVPARPERGFVRLEREWRDGDTIQLTLPMPARRVVANERVEADAGKAAIMRGPLVYAALQNDAENGWQPGMTLDDGEALAVGSVTPHGFATIQTVMRAASGASDEIARVALIPYLELNSAALAMSVWQERARAPQAPQIVRQQEETAATTATLVKGPYLVYPGKNDAMTVLWQMNGAATCRLAWGTDAQVAGGTVVSTEYGDDHQHRVTLDGLTPGARYRYSLVAGRENFEGTFRAAPPDDAASVSFFVYGDSRSHPDAHDAVAGAIVKRMEEDPQAQTLAVFSGDYTYDGNRESRWRDEFFNRETMNVRRLVASVPFMGCMGNHEGRGALFQKYFPYPFAAARYYAFDYGPAHFAVLDQYTDYRAGSAQLEWLAEDLAASSKPWKFIVVHEPAWSAGSHRDNARMQEVVQPLRKEFGVAAVLAGHNHYYARAVVDGVTHITSGGGGAPLYDPDPEKEYVVTAAKTLHFCEVTIDGDRLRLVAYTPDGEVIDDFSIEPPPAPAAANNASAERATPNDRDE